jgi:hypothetical protein
MDLWLRRTVHSTGKTRNEWGMISNTAQPRVALDSRRSYASRMLTCRQSVIDMLGKPGAFEGELVRYYMLRRQLS